MNPQNPKPTPSEPSTMADTLFPADQPAGGDRSRRSLTYSALSRSPRAWRYKTGKPRTRPAGSRFKPGKPPTKPAGTRFKPGKPDATRGAGGR